VAGVDLVTSLSMRASRLDEQPHVLAAHRLSVPAVLIPTLRDRHPQLRRQSPASRSAAIPNCAAFDEIRTGFRVAIGGAGERCGVTSDLTFVNQECPHA
jgi:hypothetical protein